MIETEFHPDHLEDLRKSELKSNQLKQWRTDMTNSNLHPLHEADLRKSGLSDETVKEAKIKIGRSVGCCPEDVENYLASYRILAREQWRAEH